MNDMARKRKARAEVRKFIINIGDGMQPRFVIDVGALARDHDERFSRSWAKFEAGLAEIAENRIKRFRNAGFTEAEIMSFLEEDRTENIARARRRGLSEEKIEAEYPPVTLTPASPPDPPRADACSASTSAGSCDR